MLTPGKTLPIAKLPPELLLNILEWADEPSVHVNVCWVFNQIATPILYRRLHLYHNIHPLLRTIIGRPTLGNFVRSLYESSDTEMLYHPIPPSFIAAAKFHGLSLEVQEAITDRSIMAILFLLLCYLPRLQEVNLRVSCEYNKTNNVFKQMLTTIPFPSALQSVRSVTLHPRYSDAAWMIIPFCYWPTLQSFTCRSAYVLDADASNSDPLPGSSRIEHLRFIASAIHHRPLNALIHSSQSLRTFVYQFVPIFGSTFHPQSLGDALRQCALHTLEHLQVSFIQINEDPHLSHSLGPLSDFPNLVCIRTAFSLLLGTRHAVSANTIAHQLTAALPCSLISLQLWIDNAWRGVSIFPVMEQFLKIRHDRLKHLKNINIRGDNEWSRTQLLCHAEGLSTEVSWQDETIFTDRDKDRCCTIGCSKW